MKNQTIERLREIKFVALATFRLPKQISRKSQENRNIRCGLKTFCGC